MWSFLTILLMVALAGLAIFFYTCCSFAEGTEVVWVEEDVALARLVLRHVYNTGVPLALVSASLLGHERHKQKVIPWCTKLAVLCSIEDRGTLRQHLRKSSAVQIHEGRWDVVALQCGHTRGASYAWPYLYVYYYTPYDSTCVTWEQEALLGRSVPRIMSLDILLPYQSSTFLEESVQIPAHPQRFLEACYGPLWQTRYTRSSYNHATGRWILYGMFDTTSLPLLPKEEEKQEEKEKTTVIELE